MDDDFNQRVELALSESLNQSQGHVINNYKTV